MEPLPTPHNNFFHFALSHTPSARSLIESQLSPRALATLKLDTLQLEQGNFVDADLREKFSDLLFSVQLADGSAGSEDEDASDEDCHALVYLLFEHKSQSDPLTVLQLLSYLVRIWEKRIRDGFPVCPIIPLVVYHGESGWTAARSMKELLAAPEGLADYQVQLEFPLLDLSQLSDPEIPGEPILRSTLQLLKYSRSRDLLEKLRGILKWIGSAIPERSLTDWVTAIGVYVITVNKNMDSQQYKQTLKSVLPTQFEVGSLADRLLIQGREEGRKEGREEGLREGIEKGIEQGIEQGMEQGKLAGKIQMLAEMLGDEAIPDSELQQHDLGALTAKLEELQSRLRDR